jgi:hypothetical protein
MPPASRSLSPLCGGESEIEGLGERKPPKLQISQVRGTVQSAQQAPHTPLILGSPPPSSISAVSAQTSASSRSGDLPFESPSGPKSHI